MPELPEGLYAGDIYYYPYGPKSDATFGYIPGPPRVDRRADGLPVGSLLMSARAAAFTLQAVWSATRGELDAAKEQIKSRYPGSGEPNLQIAALTDATASLDVTASDGTTFTFGPNRLSGIGSNAVVFSETLKSTEKLSARNALQGQTGFLKLTCNGKLSLVETCSAQISGDLAKQMKALVPKPPESTGGGWFGRKKEPPPLVLPDLAACAAGIQAALSAGEIKLTFDDTPNVSGGLRSKVETEVRAKVAKYLYDKIHELGEDATYMSSFGVNLNGLDSETIEYQISRSADIGADLADGKGAGLISEAAASLSEPNR
jgi:hypothetical protein